LGDILPAGAGLVRWDDVPETEPYPGIRARRLDTAHATVVRYEFRPGAAYPLHAHHEEQLVQVLDGRIELQVGEATLALAAGDLAHVPGDLPHGARCAGDRAVFLNIAVPRRP
jgi:quercetin dioxygenase-like cupin family protein